MSRALSAPPTVNIVHLAPKIKFFLIWVPELPERQLNGMHWLHYAKVQCQEEMQLAGPAPITSRTS